MEGWICPQCKRGVAPSEKHCDHGAFEALASIEWAPRDPLQPVTSQIGYGSLTVEATDTTITNGGIQ